MAQVIQEDEGETPQTLDNNESHDAHEIHEQESDGREETPVPKETEEAPEHSVNPIMSLMMPMRFMNKKVTDGRRPPSLRRPKRPLNIL
jgi:hypothetical protein